MIPLKQLIVYSLTLTLATTLLKVNDFKTTSIAQASGLTAIAVILSATSPIILARLVLTFFTSNITDQLAFRVAAAFGTTGIVVATVISFYIAVKQARRVHSSDKEYSILQTSFNKKALICIMIIIGLFIFGLSVPSLFENWELFHVVTTNFHAAMLFSTGILGLISHKKQSVDLNIWTRTLADFTTGISVASTISIVQLLVSYASQSNYTKWQIRPDFTILILCLALFNFIGFMLSFTASAATDDILHKVPQPSKSSNTDTVNVGMLVSAVLAGAVGIFNMAIMNYPTYGFPALVVSTMAYITSRRGTDIQTTNNELLRFPYHIFYVFNSFGSVWAIGMTIYAFVADKPSQTSLLVVIPAFIYPFTTIAILSLLPVAYFSVRAAFCNKKDTCNEDDASTIIA
ncbi:uncharacterized protein TRIADDRAFT_62448 [Trichoplax adhaerens]|uniref:Uncharacterized protein n=1 Tax=Trichoplax adhaerens TaxID=10228 RepID=B3SDU1_TRIAD|nr:predicted protein [Trichoplax adhaerens]EDV19104.1 predicted protein [Trichoplax adhaerens]|eukprot:XP_002118410.1 predicted protein [Trichoplax adhaerens]